MLILPAVASRAFCFLGAEVGVGANLITPSGNVTYKGAALDLKNDLNLGQITTYMARVRIETPLFLPNIYLVANPMKFEGTQVRTTTFQYGDNTFSASVPYNTSLKLDHYDLTLFYGIPFLKTVSDDMVNVDLGLNLRFIDFKGDITQPATGLTQSKAQAIPVPMGYVAAQVSPLEMFEIDAEVQGIGYGGNQYVDAMGRIKFKPIKFFFIAAGYSFQGIKIDVNDIKTDLQFGGPVAEIGVQF